MVSSSEASEVFSSDLLLEVAPLACTEIICCAKTMKGLPSVPGGQIGATLHLIAYHLEITQPLQLPSAT